MWQVSFFFLHMSFDITLYLGCPFLFVIMDSPGLCSEFSKF